MPAIIIQKSKKQNIMKKLFLPIAAVAFLLTACLQTEPDINQTRLALGVVTGPAVMLPGEDATITAVVTKRDISITSVVIEWRKNGAPQDNEPMTLGENNVWTGTIDGQEEGVTVTWNILVIKANGDREQSTQREITWASIIAAWNFPDFVVPNEDNIWSATSGANTSGTNLQFFYAGNGPQATLGRAGEDRRALNVPNRAVTADGWIPGERPANDVEVHTTAENSAGWIITLNTTGFENITFSADQSSSNNGPRAFNLAYRIGTTGTWTVFGETGIVTAMGDMPGGDMAATFTNVPLPETVNNQAEVQVRVWIANNTQRSDGRFRLNNDGGNTSINNIVFAVGSGDTPPPPPPPTDLEITNVGHQPTVPTQDDPITVSATVTAPEGATIATVYLEWTRNTTAQTPILMTATASVFSAIIPEQNIDDAITYRIVATNNLGEVTESDWSNFTVIDGTEPIGGTIGGLTWGVANNVLTISVTATSGTAAMEDFYLPDGLGNDGLSPAPWTEHRALFNQVVIAERVTSIGEESFRGIREITALTIGEDVVTIGANAFRGLTQLTSVTIPNSVTTIGSEAFRGLNVASADADASTLATVTLGTGVITIGAEAFRQLPLLTSIVIPNSVITIGEAVFRQSGLASVTLGTGLLTIGVDAFRESALVSVVIPNSVTTIEEDAFRQIQPLTSVTIGTGITTLGRRIFRESPALTTVTILRETPPTTVDRPFEGIAAGACLYVPVGSVTAYQNATGFGTGAQAISCINSIP